MRKRAITGFSWSPPPWCGNVFFCQHYTIWFVNQTFPCPSSGLVIYVNRRCAFVHLHLNWINHHSWTISLRIFVWLLHSIRKLQLCFSSNICTIWFCLVPYLYPFVYIVWKNRISDIKKLNFSKKFQKEIPALDLLQTGMAVYAVFMLTDSNLSSCVLKA